MKLPYNCYPFYTHAIRALNLLLHITLDGKSETQESRYLSKHWLVKRQSKKKKKANFFK